MTFEIQFFEFIAFLNACGFGKFSLFLMFIFLQFSQKNSGHALINIGQDLATFVFRGKKS